MPGHRSDRDERRAGARKAARAVVDPTPVYRPTAVVDGHVPRRRPHPGREPRVDPTRVTGPLRLVLEPLLWIAFAAGVLWFLVALDPAVRRQAGDLLSGRLGDPMTGAHLYRHTLPLSILVGTLLLISTVTALMWLPTSTTAARARTSFAGLGMLASGWLFSAVDPVDTRDFLGMSWLCIGIGVLLVALCAVPWPTVASRQPSPLGPVGRMVVLALVVAICFVGLLAWETSQRGLLTFRDDGAWEELLPLVLLLAALTAAVRQVVRRPARPAHRPTHRPDQQAALRRTDRDVVPVGVPGGVPGDVQDDTGGPYVASHEGPYDDRHDDSPDAR